MIEDFKSLKSLDKLETLVVLNVIEFLFSNTVLIMIIEQGAYFTYFH